MIKDAQGQAVTGVTPESVALYDQAVRAFNLGYRDAVGLFDAARQASPDFVMAHLGKAWLFAISNDPSFAGQARTLIETAEKLAMNDREQGHLAALNKALASERRAAVGLLDRHLMHYPFDTMGHQAAVLL